MSLTITKEFGEFEAKSFLSDFYAGNLTGRSKKKRKEKKTNSCKWIFTKYCTDFCENYKVNISHGHWHQDLDSDFIKNEWK